MKRIIFNLLLSIHCIILSTNISGQNGIYNYKNERTACLVFINLFRPTINYNSWETFHRSTFEIQQALEYAKQNSLPMLLIVPNIFSQVSPIEDLAPWKEGSRVALAWASAYSRFNTLGNVPLYIIYSTTDSDHISIPTIINAVEYILSKSIVTNANDTPEENVQNHCFSFEQIDRKLFYSSNATLELMHFNERPSSKTLIIPPLNKTKKDQKRFLITGAAGFIGSHLSKALLNEGHQVIGLDNFSCCSGENITDLSSNHNFYFQLCDVTQPFQIDGPIDTIIHLASIPSPNFYYAMPIETLKTGLHATKNTLDLAVEKNAQYVFASTSEVYGDPEISPQSESYCGNVSPIGKRSQYDMSKRGAETLIKLYFDKYNLDVRIARIFNTYGPGMELNDGRVITNFIRSIMTSEPFIIYGDGNQTRSFAYVSDTVDGILKLIHTEEINSKTPLINRIFNIGNDEEFTINELAYCMNAIAVNHGYKPVMLKHIPQIDPTDPKLRCPDLTKAKSILHFSPSVQLNEGLEKTLQYFTQKMRYL